jgi:Xaa-Pro aminopeptidase
MRIESHLVVIPSRHAGFLEFETISRLPIDPRLVDFRRLSPSERQWLADYHRSVVRDLEHQLDGPTAAWLRALVQDFIRADSPTDRPDAMSAG